MLVREVVVAGGFPAGVDRRPVRVGDFRAGRVVALLLDE